MARVVLWSLAVAHLAHGLVLRRRRAAVEVVGAPPAELAGHDGSSRVVADDLTVLSVPGVEVDGATREAVARDMNATGVEVVDLVPGDMPADDLLRLLNRVEVTRLSEDPLYAPYGAHQAMVLHPAAASRTGLTERTVTCETGELARWTMQAQRCAPTATVLRLAPNLRARAEAPDDRWQVLEHVTSAAMPYVALSPLFVGSAAAHLLALSAGALVSPLASAAALAAWTAKPALVGSRDALAASVARLPRAWAGTVATARAGRRTMRAAAARRAATPAPNAPPADELFEPRRDTCPWCGCPDLAGRLDTTDLLQHKPGTFHLDRCTGCGHVFQNPALSLAGLDFYYEEFYDGASGELAESAFAGMAASYEGRAEAVARFVEPRSWLDVGAGHGHFCLVARQRWPEARFDGLDLSESIDEARRRGWIDTAYRGLFPDLADGLPHSYDVVSMHHYLEHTREPRLELRAAAKVLEPGGYLMVEVPDPESPLGRRLGRYWPCWFQPQHQHMVPCANLVAELGETGFEVVSVERGPATTSADLSFALLLAANRWAPSPFNPWSPRPSAVDRAKRLGLLGVLPALAATLLADGVIAARHRRPGNPAVSNAYRIVARRL